MNIPIGTTYGKNPTYAVKTPILLDPETHTMVLGVSGSGKSTKLEAMIDADIRAGRGICLIDPHAVLVQNILKRIPKRLIPKVRILDPHSKKVLGIKLLEHGDQTRANDLVEILRIFGSGDDSIRARAEMLLKNILYSIVSLEREPSIWHLGKYFTEDSYRDKTSAKVDDLQLKNFATYWNQDVNERMREDAEVAPYGKVSLILAMKKLLHFFVQTQGTLDFLEAMQEGYIILCPLDSARLGYKETQAAGSAILLNIVQAAKQRFALSDKPIFRVYVDEAHIVTYGSSIEQLMAETRKGNVFLTLAFQMLSQFEEVARDAIRSARNQLIFAVSDPDAERLAPGFGVPSTRLTHLPTGFCYGKIIEKDTTAGPYLIEPEIWEDKRGGNSSKDKTRAVRYTPPFRGDETSPEQILEYHAANFGKLREEIDQELESI